MPSRSSFGIAHRSAQWLASALLAACAIAPATAAPNVLFILTDNLGYGELGSYGGGATRGVPTPQIDRLAADGLRLTNYITDSLCTPSRSEIMTGRYAVRSGTYSVPFGGVRDGLTRWEITIAEAIRARGYATAFFGKWHLGSSKGRLPTDQGFDYWYGIPRTSDEVLWPEHNQSASVVPPEQVMQSDGQHVHDVAIYDKKERSLIDAELVRQSIEFMKDQVRQKRSFFAFVSLTQVHFPVIPNPKFAGKTGNGDFSDAIAEMDYNVGQLVETVDRLGVGKDTIIIFTSDNGPEPEGSAGPWRSVGVSGYEGDIRVPFIIRWTGRIPAGRTRDGLVNNTDIFPTLAAMTGAAVPTDRPIDGVNQSAFFTGKSEKSARESALIWLGQTLIAVKWHNWKMHFYKKDELFGPLEKLAFPYIVNLWSDPHELHPSNATWVIKPMLDAVNSFNSSIKKYPLIPMGTDEPYKPSNPCDDKCTKIHQK